VENNHIEITGDISEVAHLPCEGVRVAEYVAGAACIDATFMVMPADRTSGVRRLLTSVDMARRKWRPVAHPQPGSKYRVQGTGLGVSGGGGGGGGSFLDGPDEVARRSK
jgi:hypothetical protein